MDSTLDASGRSIGATLTAQAELGDYIALLKPRMMSLVLFTAGVGMAVAPGAIHPVLAIAALACIAVGAGAAGALNMWYDADIDGRMARTAARPIPRGRIAAGEALGFGAALAVGAVATMGLLVNLAAAAILAVTIGFYLFVYTMWLKRRTAHNTVIGGAAGAFPPMIGWAAVTGGLDWGAVVLFAIVFLWQPTHFWALALYRAGDYARVGIPMLPVVSGEAETKRQMLLYAVILYPVTLLPLLLGFGHALYAATAIPLGLAFIALTVAVWRADDLAAQAYAPARRLFGYSILYLFLLFAALLAERLMGLA
jgi:heme o synthase